MKGQYMQVGSINLSIESDFKHVFLIGKAISSLCSLANFSDMDSYQVELCVVEAVNNAIKHAYEEKEGNLLEVKFSLYQSKITIAICDAGKVMDQNLLLRARALPDFDAQDLDTLPEGGWGLAIMHQVMDEVTYSTSNGTNVLTLSKYFTPGKSDAGQHHALPSA